MFDNKWQKKEMPLVSLIGMGGGIASPAFLASIVLNILKPTVFSPIDDTGVPDFDYTAESSAITNVGTVDALGGVGFSADIWTGDGNSNGQKIATGVDLLTDGGMVWIKARDRSSGDLYSRHFIWDTERGSTDTSYLSPDVEDAEGQQGSLGGKIDILSDGFTAGGPGANNNETYVGWSFRKAPGFFDIVTYDGDGGVQNVSHNLGQAPGIMIVKSTSHDGYGWYVYHHSVENAEGKYGNLHGPDQFNNNNMWNNTSPTDSVFTVTGNYTNGSGASFVAYLFADNPSQNIACGSYTESTTRQEVNIGFKPEFLLYKGESYGNWRLLDTTRGFSSDSPARTLEADNAEAEKNENAFFLRDNGFSAPSSWYGNGEKILYMAIGSPNFNVPTTQLTLTDTTVSKVSDGSLIGGTSIDQVLTVGETVQADTTISSTVTIPVFNTTNYSGTGSTMSISTGIDLTTKGLLWFRGRGGSGYQTNQHVSFLFDSERNDYGSYLGTHGADGQGDFASYGWNPQPAADGTISNLQANLIHNNVDWVNWAFRAAPGFFDIVKWNASDLTTGDYMVNHNLGTTPGMIICKNIDNSSGAPWYVYHKDATSSSSSDPNAHFLSLNGTSKAVWSSGMSDPNSDFGGWAVTDTQFRASGSLGLDNGSDNFIAYVFAEDTPGLIKCGKYTAPNPAGILTVNTGFQPHWVMVKCTSVSNSDWVIFDKNLTGGAFLRANESSAQDYAGIVFESTGFKINDYNNAHYNNAGAEFIYIAIAENAEADITTQSTATGEVSASSGNTITLSNTTGTWSTGMKVQGTDSDTKDNPDPIKVEDVSLTSSAPTAERNVSTWGDAVWEIATDENFTQNVQTATTALSATGTQSGPSFTLERETGYYTRTKYTALGQESEWSDVTYFVTRARYVDSFWINTFNHNGWDYEYTEGLDSDDNGNVYVISIRYSAGGSGYKGMSLVKLDPNGDIQWQKYLTYNIPGDRTYSLESRTVSVTPDGSEIFVTAQGDLGMIVCKFNSDGDLQWTKKLGGVNSNNFSYGTTLTSSGELVMFGRDYENSGVHTFVTQISNTGSQTFYSSIGRTSGDTTALAYECEPFVDSDDNIHFVINSWNGSKRTPGVVKYNSSGVLQSVSDFNSTVDTSIADEDHFADITVDGSGNKYITYRRDVTATHVSGMRSGLLKLNSSDEIQWQSEISGPDPIYPLQVNIDSSGDIVSAFQDRRTNSAIIITKHTSDGTLVWKRSFRHTSREINPNAEVRINRNDNILLNSHIYGDVKTIVCQFPSDGSLTGSYMATVGYFNWEDATHITVSSSTAYFKNGSSIYSAKSTSMSMSSFSNTNTGDNILTVNKIDIPTP